MSNQIAALEALNVEGWTQFRPLTLRDRKVFNEARKGIFGDEYTPLEVSTQIVNGTNYRIKCSVSLPPTKIVCEAIVNVYEPIGGKPRITDFVESSIYSKKGTEEEWLKDEPLTVDERALFDAAISAIVGISYGLN